MWRQPGQKRRFPFMNILLKRQNNRESKKVATGQFGADMQVYIQNDGPVTLMLDTDEIMRRGVK